MMRYVIVGNSAAAVGAVEAIRRHDPDNPITIVADEPHHVYSRPLISYLLGGLIDESRMYYRPADFYDHHRVQTMLGVKVESVDPRAHTLSLAGGGALPYDRLLISTGGKPFVPPLPGSDVHGIFTFTTWDDARRIGRYMDEYGVRSAVVVGGGLIGLKTIEALLARGGPHAQGGGVHVTVIELADRILSTMFDRTASKLAEQILRRQGVDIRTGATVEEIAMRSGRVDHVTLHDRERIDCDMLVFAIGVRPNVDLIPPDSGIEVGRGISVDPGMRTTAEDVYAAGDCVEALDMLSDSNRVIAIWPNAYRQGAVAGSNMAGVRKRYGDGFAMNSIEVCGVPTISVGISDPQPGDDGYEVMEAYDRETPIYKKLVLRHGRLGGATLVGATLVGAILIGDIDRAGIYTGLIRDQVDVQPFQNHLLSGNFGLISLPKAYRKHLVVGDSIEV
jgi:nitrite reductase (NADH) large subunit